MARRGRKRKQGAREGSGRLKRKSGKERLDERLRFARSLPHRRSVKSNDRISELAESPLGRLRLTRRLTSREFAAGETFAAIVASYRIVIEGPRPVRSLMPNTAAETVATSDDLAIERFDCPSQYANPIETRVRLGNLAVTVRKWPCQVAGGVCACRDRRERYMRAYDAVAGAGRRSLLAVVTVAVRNDELPPQELVYLKRGLNALAQFLRLTDD